MAVPAPAPDNHCQPPPGAGTGDAAIMRTGPQGLSHILTGDPAPFFLREKRGGGAAGGIQGQRSGFRGRRGAFPGFLGEVFITVYDGFGVDVGPLDPADDVSGQRLPFHFG